MEMVSRTPLIDANTALTIAQSAGNISGGLAMQPPRLGIFTTSGSPHLSYEIFLYNTSGEAWLYYIDAMSGEILWSSDQVPKYDGTLKIYVGRPHDGTSKYARPLPYARIYEDYRYYSDFGGCENPITVGRWRGDTSRLLGSTDWSGNYSGLTGIDPSDTYWTIDFIGTYMRDKGTQSVLHLDDFPAGGIYTFPQSADYQRSRRGEFFYLLNYGRKFYSEAAYNTPIFDQIDFSYKEEESYPCQSPSDPIHCCEGYALGPCVEMVCGLDMGITAAPSVERRFRGVVYHELNHTLRPRVAPNVCYNCSGTSTVDGPECKLWEEGRADYGKVTVGEAENVRSEYRPSRKYPDDFTCLDRYLGGSIWTALYVHYMLHWGPGPATKDIHYNLANVDLNTRMVGSCTDSDGDTYVEVSECNPINSNYRLLLEANSSIWNGKYQRQNEISEVFHWHVTDADRATPGSQGFPWADEMPNHYANPPFVSAEFGIIKTITVGPDPDSGLLRLEKSSDYDTVMFLGRGGESYYIETTNISSGMDTFLEILNRNGTVIAYNDDCGASPRSCLTLSPSTSDYYRIRVSPVPGSATGPDKTYWMRIQIQNDDYGDNMAGAAALVTNNVFRSANFNSASDIDYFRIISSASQTLSFMGCSDVGISTKVDLINSTGILLATFTNTSCSSSPYSISIDRGTYFLKASTPMGSTGAYKIKANLTTDIDVDSTATNAWTLSADANLGRVIGTRFETTSDEDWFKFMGGSKCRNYIIETWGLDSGVDTIIEIYAPSSTIWSRTGTLDSLPDTSNGNGLGHWMLQDDDGALDSRGSRIAFATPVIGTYYVRVKNKGTSSGSYYIAFEDTGLISTCWPSYP
uniref:Peptidase C-terminal archaeal/bacterial domain-containing protein n=1 Tax=candidate division WOR-3 bacterium TaxID=2052148 RepID=A0A7V3VTF2_UNCW3